MCVCVCVCVCVYTVYITILTLSIHKVLFRQKYKRKVNWEWNRNYMKELHIWKTIIHSFYYDFKLPLSFLPFKWCVIHLLYIYHKRKRTSNIFLKSQWCSDYYGWLRIRCPEFDPGQTRAGGAQLTPQFKLVDKRLASETKGR